MNSKPIGFGTYNSAITGEAPANSPFETPTTFVFLGFGPGGANGWGWQFIVTIGPLSEFYYRCHTSTTFNSWKKVTIS